MTIATQAMTMLTTLLLLAVLASNANGLQVTYCSSDNTADDSTKTTTIRATALAKFNVKATTPSLSFKETYAGVQTSRQRIQPMVQAAIKGVLVFLATLAETPTKDFTDISKLEVIRSQEQLVPRHQVQRRQHQPAVLRRQAHHRPPPSPSSPSPTSTTSSSTSFPSSSQSASTITEAPSSVTSVVTQTQEGKTVLQTIVTTPTPEPVAGPRPKASSGISHGAVAGIVIGVLAALGLVAAGLIMYYRRRLKQERRRTQYQDDSGSFGPHAEKYSPMENEGQKWDPTFGIGFMPGRKSQRSSTHLKTTTSRRSTNADTSISPIDRQSMTFVDSRLNPQSFGVHEAGRVSAHSLADHQDYSRPLRVTNGDDPQ
ncbi:MAG: hypothetical protein Q9160_005366 [Pyrenula sp. 1 TL-2023]